MTRLCFQEMFFANGTACEDTGSDDAWDKCTLTPAARSEPTNDARVHLPGVPRAVH